MLDFDAWELVVRHKAAPSLDSCEGAAGFGGLDFAAIARSDE